MTSKILPIVLLVLAATCRAQLKADPELIDEFPPYGCENVLARSAGFVNELRKDPKLTGIIIVYGGGVESEKADRVSQMIHRVVLGSLGFDSNVIVLRNSTKDEVYIQSWLSQSKGLIAFPNSKVVATIPFKIEARFYFGAETGDPCSNNISHTFA